VSSEALRGKAAAPLLPIRRQENHDQGGGKEKRIKKKRRSIFRYNI